MSGIDVDRQWKLYINGEWVATDATYDIIDPNTTKVVGHAPEATAALLDPEVGGAQCIATGALAQYARQTA